MLRQFLFNLRYPKGEHFDYFSNSKVGIMISFPLNTFRTQFVLDFLDLLEPLGVFKQFEIKHKVTGTKAQDLKETFLRHFKKVYNDERDGMYWQHVTFRTKQGVEVLFHYPFHWKQPPNVVHMEIPLPIFLAFEQTDSWQTILAMDFVSCFVFNLNYFYAQGDLNYFSVKYDGIPSNYYTYTINDTNDHVVDIEQNAGKATVITDTWLMAAWKMYFGNKFYDLVSKEKLLGFKYAEIVKEMNDDKVFINLYEAFNEPHFKKNRKKQLAFLEYIEYENLIKKDRVR